MAHSRVDKINAEMMRVISEIIRDRLSDPRLVGVVTVVGVQATSDLRHAKVYISVYHKDEAVADGTFAFIKERAGFIRSETAHMMRTYTTPELNIIRDRSMETGMAMSRKIEELKDK